MDPYLENRALWPDFHNSFIAAIREWVAPLVRPRYYVALEERTYLFRSFDIEVIGRPDVAVIEGPGARGPSPKERTVAESAVLGCAVFTAYGAVRHGADLRGGEDRKSVV